MKTLKVLALLAAATFASLAETKLLVTVIEPKTGRPVTDLKASEFAVLDDKTPRKVEAAEYSSGGLMDIMLLLDSSLAGGIVQPVAQSLIDQIQPKDQMAVVSFHSSADLIQDFTSSKDLLRRALAGVKYGNSPRILDALYAAIDGGFQSSSQRRVIIVLTAGMEGPSRVNEREVLKLARRGGVSIYPVYVAGFERSLFENLARQTGGASFNLRDMRKGIEGPPGPRIFEVVRSHYTLTLSGNLSLGERVKIEVQRPGKLMASHLPLD
jgi:VWFA-related protein